jgi:hypothetical protein
MTSRQYLSGPAGRQAALRRVPPLKSLLKYILSAAVLNRHRYCSSI